jgi:sulfatase-like protein
MIRIATAIAAACLVALAGCTTSSDGKSQPHAAKRHEAHPPVVFIAFDEFSTTSLLDGHGRIDSARYPNFAAVARDGDWFPYATASSDETGRAMGALLTGSLPSRGEPPTYGAHPRNVFTLMGRRYRIRAHEEVTSICPRRLCPGVRRQTKHSVLHELGTGRPDRFDRWVRSIRGARKPTLFFAHALFPHAPWRYLPSGRTYVRVHDPITGYGHAFFNPWVVRQKYQRHLLQLGFADRLLGKALQRLRDAGLYDRAVIVVTADNGESFGRLGNGHEVNGSNYGDIALTPLIIKRPFRHHAAVIRRHVRTVDVVPTVARLAGVRLRWRVQGRSVYGPGARRIPAATTVFQRSGRRFRLTLGGLRRWARAAERRKLALFGAGTGGPGLYRIGPERALVGTPLAHWKVSSAGGSRAAVTDRRAFDAVRLSSSFIPSYVIGRLTGARPPQAIAVALNGQIVATAPSYRVHRGSPLFFSALLPESVFREGRNELRVFGVAGRGRGLRLGPLGP